jgi:hypothetical protein
VLLSHKSGSLPTVKSVGRSVGNIAAPGDGGLFRLHNVTIVGFYYLLLLKLLQVSVIII